MSVRATTPEERFEAYLHRLGTVMGHADRLEPLRGYLTGLLLPGERKSVEPMAAKLDPTRVRARHQSLHHFVASSAWDQEAVLAVARDYALEQMERHGPVEAWVVDDTGFPKKGTHSVGVARQYCGPLGKQDNCQVTVTLSLCSSVMSVPSAYRFYLPESWAGDAARRSAAGIPEQVRFQPKWEIALSQVDALLQGAVAPGSRGGRRRLRRHHRRFERRSPRVASPTLSASPPRLPSGPRPSNRYRPSPTVAWGARPNGCAALPGTRLLPSRPWP